VHPLTARDRHVQAFVPNPRHLTFSAYRRIATMIMVPAEGVRDSMEMLSIGSVDLANAQAADASATHD
jgi:hypothetical protein